MNKLAALLILCVVCAILKATVVALIAALLLALLWSFITQPRETLVLLVTLALMGLANAHPLAFISGGVVIIVVVAVLGRTQHRPTANLLDHLS